jgi:MerR, DNA binding
VAALRDRGETPCDHVYHLLLRRTAELDDRIEELGRLRRELKALTKRAGHLDSADCNPRGVCHLITSTVDGGEAQQGRRLPRPASEAVAGGSVRRPRGGRRGTDPRPAAAAGLVGPAAIRNTDG